jgi:hypothetical protein
MRSIFVVVVVLLLMAGGLYLWRTQDPDEIHYVLPKDRIASIDDPTFSDGAWFPPDDLVIGVNFSEQARAYPLSLLSSHEIVNDRAGEGSDEVRFAVTWCPLCFTAIVYDADVEGRHLTFGVSGNLQMNNLVMYDRQTDTLWSQQEGRGLKGQLEGTELKVLPSRLMTWEEWQIVEPGSVLLEPPDGEARPYSDPYASYYQDDRTLFPVVHQDDSLEPKQLVLGVIRDSKARAYPIHPRDGGQVVNDELGGDHILITFYGTASAAAFLRPGRSVTFTVGGGMVINSTSGERYNLLTGVSVDGGEPLQEVPSEVSFWFAWKDHYPETTVHGVDEDAGTSTMLFLSQITFLILLVVVAMIYGGWTVYDHLRLDTVSKVWAEADWNTWHQDLVHGVLLFIPAFASWQLGRRTISPVVGPLLDLIGWALVGISFYLFFEAYLLWERRWTNRQTRMSQPEMVGALEKGGWKVDPVPSRSPYLAYTLDREEEVDGEVTLSRAVGAIGHLGDVFIVSEQRRPLELALTGHFTRLNRRG